MVIWRTDILWQSKPFSLFSPSKLLDNNDFGKHWRSGGFTHSLIAYDICWRAYVFNKSFATKEQRLNLTVYGVISYTA